MQSENSSMLFNLLERITFSQSSGWEHGKQIWRSSRSIDFRESLRSTISLQNHPRRGRVVIGKKLHTLVKENTPRRHKIRREWGFTQKFTFFFVSLCFLPYCCANIGIPYREVRLMLPNTYQEIFDTYICLNF